MNTSPPVVSVVIPNYPDALLVRETLESIRETIPVEVVVVDDASPVEGTAAALGQYRDQGLIDRLVLLEENGGHQRAINAGIAASSAPLIYVLGNDDLLIAGALGKLAALLERDPGASFVCGAYERFGAARGVYRPPAWDPWRLLYASPYPGSYLVRRSALALVGGIQSNCVFEDWDTYVTYAEHGLRGLVLDEVVYRYRIHDATRLSARSQRTFRIQVERLRAAHKEFFSDAANLRKGSTASPVRKAWQPIYFGVRLRTPSRLIQIAHRFAFGQRRASADS